MVSQLAPLRQHWLCTGTAQPLAAGPTRRDPPVSTFEQPALSRTEKELIELIEDQRNLLIAIATGYIGPATDINTVSKWLFFGKTYGSYAFDTSEPVGDHMPLFTCQRSIVRDCYYECTWGFFGDLYVNAKVCSQMRGLLLGKNTSEYRFVLLEFALPCSLS